MFPEKSCPLRPARLSDTFRFSQEHLPVFHLRPAGSVWLFRRSCALVLRPEFMVGSDPECCAVQTDLSLQQVNLNPGDADFAAMLERAVALCNLGPYIYQQGWLNAAALREIG